MVVTPALRDEVRQEDGESDVSLGYLARKVLSPETGEEKQGRRDQYVCSEYMDSKF